MSGYNQLTNFPTAFVWNIYISIYYYLQSNIYEGMQTKLILNDIHIDGNFNVIIY